jgi:hypothetical protein
VQLLSGYRGSGKTTELQRMVSRLEAESYVAVMSDIEDYLSPGTPVELVDFLLGFTGALSDACDERNVDLGAGGSLWDRAVNLLGRLKPEEFTVGIPQTGPELKVAIKESTDFVSRLRTFMAGRLGELLIEVRDYVELARRALLTTFPDAPGVVIVVDSIEHFRGTASTEDEVQQSIEKLFGENADALHFGNLHVVYTVPPYLRVRVPNVAERFEPGLGMQVLPTVKTHTQEGDVYQPGMDALRDVVGARGDWQRVLSDSQLAELCNASGGHLRDLMRMMQDLLRRCRQRGTDKASDGLVEESIEAAARDMLPIADDDARWLWRIHQEHEYPLPSIDQLPRLSRFFDTHLVLCYRNGREWYDVHPLIASDLERQVARLGLEDG